jgi:hypothetical protein
MYLLQRPLGWIKFKIYTVVLGEKPLNGKRDRSFGFVCNCEAIIE